MGWIYKLSKTAQEKKSATDLLNYDAYNRYGKKPVQYTDKESAEDNLAPSFERFFNHPYIQKLVADNEWDKVIDAWENDFARGKAGKEVYGNRVGWDTTLLTDALALAGIDFWSYLPDNFNPIEYFLDANIEWSD